MAVDDLSEISQDYAQPGRLLEDAIFYNFTKKIWNCFRAEIFLRETSKLDLRLAQIKSAFKSLLSDI